MTDDHWTANIDPEDPFDALLLAVRAVVQRRAEADPEADLWLEVDDLADAWGAYEAELTYQAAQIRARMDGWTAELTAWYDCGTDPIRLGC